ncbi:hypothetical protein L1049_014740 [Liquidambar formosana]|uniref:Zinc finger BED domain-containing protein RICESLEEPER 2-like n=1 Tax=Liquidambar formosana TaxID=63359 RepID=A0AAP0RX14_LIQFO
MENNNEDEPQNINDENIDNNGSQDEEVVVGGIEKAQCPTRWNSKKLLLDCPTRWNSTYLMLAAALEFKEVFPRYQERDSGYTYLPNSEDWEKAEIVCQFLEVFNEVTNIVSGSEYPTSNLFLTEIWRVKEILNDKLVDERPYIKAMARKMNEKFEKYWGECNLLMAIAGVLDPRYKMVLVEYCFSEIYPEGEATRNINSVREALYKIFKEYAANHTLTLSSNVVPSTAQDTQHCVSSSSNNSSSFGRSVASGKSRFESFVKRVDTIQPVKSDLDVYLEEGVYICGDGANDNFDALEWWKVNNLKFRILSKMAGDILSIPITTVASESAFSAGGRVIDPYRSSLATDTVQVLMCGADWARNLRGIKKSLNDPVEV